MELQRWKFEMDGGCTEDKVDKEIINSWWIGVIIRKKIIINRKYKLTR